MSTPQTLKWAAVLFLCVVNAVFMHSQTAIVIDLNNSGSVSSNPKSIINYQNRVYFLAKNLATGVNQLYRSNTSSSGTIRLDALASNDIVGNLVVSDSITTDGTELPKHNLFFVRKRLLAGKNQFELFRFDGSTAFNIKNLTTVMRAKDTTPIAAVELQTSALEISGNDSRSYVHPITILSDSGRYYSSINLRSNADSFRWTQGVNYDEQTGEIVAFPTTAVWFFPHKVKRSENHDDDFDLDEPIRTRDDNAQGARTNKNLIPDTIVGLAAGYENRNDNSIIGTSEARFMFFSIKNGVKRLKSMLYPVGNISDTRIPTEPYLVQESPPLSIDVVKKGVYYQDNVYFKAVNSGIWKCGFGNLIPKLFFNNPTADNLTLIDNRAFFTATNADAPNGAIFEVINDTTFRARRLALGEAFQKFFTLNGFCFVLTKTGTTYTFYRVDGLNVFSLGTAQNVDVSAGFALINRNILVFSADNPAEGKGQELYRLTLPSNTNVSCASKPIIINCPDNFGVHQVSAAAGASTANVPLPTITVNDACGGTLIRPTFPRTLTQVPIGDTTYYYTATNAYGTTTCRFKIRVTNNNSSNCNTDIVKPTIRNCPSNTVYHSYSSGFIARQEHCIKLNDLDKDKRMQLLTKFNDISGTDDFESYDNCATTPIIESNVKADSCLIPDFLYTITARARDARNNRSDPCTFTFKYINLSCFPDSSGPEVFNCNDSINISINNVQTCSVANLTIPSFRDYCDPNPSILASPRIDTCFPKGRTRMTFTMTDRSGNKSVCAFPVSVISTACATNRIAPSVTNCPNTITVNTRNDSAAVSWQSPRFTDGSCGVVLVDSTHKSGSKFKSGTTTPISYTATNSRGLTRTCTFNVVVNGCAASTSSVSLAICQGNFVQIGTKQYRTTGSYRDTLTSSSGCDSIINLTLTVNPLPTADILGSTSFCAGGSTTLTASGGISYRWSTNATTAIINPTTAGNYTVTVTDLNGCQNTNTKIVTVNPSPTAVISGTFSFCQGERATLRASGGVTYRWSNTTQTTDSLVVTTAGTYTVTVTDANSCSNSRSQTVTVNSLPTPTITGNNSACEGTNITLTASAAVSYLWSNGATDPSVSVGQTGNYFVTVTDVNGCKGSINKNITINPLPNAEITGSSSICTGSSTVLTATGGGTYLWSTNATTASISVAQAGIYTVTVTSAQNCTKTASKTVSINNVLQPNITGRNTVCTGDSTVLTTSGGTSYAWSNNATTASITVKQAGSYTVTVTNANNCNGTASIIVSINPLPTPIISGNNSFCEGSSTVLTASGGTSYLWSNGQTTASVSVTQADNYFVTVTNANGCSAKTNKIMTINPLPTPSISGVLTFCAGGSTTLTAFGGVSYRWSTNATTAIINPNTAGNYTVTVTDLNGCQNTNSKIVTVNSLPTAVISGSVSFCQGGQTILTASGGLTYKWSNNLTTDAIVVVQAGNYTVTVTDANSCSNTKSQPITVNSRPTPTITGNNSACEGTNITLTASAAVSYLWSNGATDPSVSVAQTGNYFVTVTDANGCKGSINKNITINPLPNAEITGSSSICTGSSTVLTATGGGTYLWSTNATTASISVAQAGIYTVTVTSAQNCTKTVSKTVSINNVLQPNITGSTAFCTGDSTVLTTSGGTSYSWSNGATTASITVRQAGSYNVTVTNTNGCNGSANIIIAVNPLPTPLIDGESSFCEGTSVILTASGGSRYAWSNGQTTPSVLVNQIGNYIVTVTDANGCSAKTNKIMTVRPLPNAIISGVTTFCAGTSTTLTASGGSSYLWSTGATTASINPNQAGNYTVTVTDANGCKNTTSKAVIVNPLPTVIITGANSFCQGGQTSLRASGGTSYLWSNNQTTDAIIITQAGTFAVTVTDANNCSISKSQIITINPLPTPIISGITSACEGSGITLSATTAVSYLWSTGATTPSVSVNQTGNYFVTVTDVNGCSGSTNKNITFNSLPNAEITGSSSICTGSNTILTATGGGTYKWSTNETTASITISQANTYTVTVTSAQGCTKTVSKIVTIGNTLQPSITGNTTFCPSDSTILTTNGGTIYVWSNGATTPSITVRQAGTYTVTVTNAASCTGSTSVGVTLKSVPNAVITANGPLSICQGNTVRLTASGGINYLWSTTETTPSIAVTNSGNYFVTVSNTEGCRSSTSKIITVSPKPTARFIAIIEGGRVTTVNQSTNARFYTWKFGDGGISLEVEPVYTYQINGTYCVQLIAQTAEGCRDTFVRCLTISRVATKDLPEGFSIDVSPNPFSDFLNVKVVLPVNLTKKEMDVITIYDILGHPIKWVKLENNLMSINSQDWLEGVYFIRATINNRQYLVSKLVKINR